MRDKEELLAAIRRIQQQAEQSERTKPEPVEMWAWIPVRYRNAELREFNNPTQKATLDCVTANIRSENMFWIGKPGTGKTHLAYACVKAYRAKYRTLMMVYQEIKNNWDEETYIIKDLVRCPILILDEIGRSSGSNWEHDILFQIIDGRYNDCKPTVIISNLTDKGVYDYLGIALHDRLRPIRVPFTWGSFREGNKN